MVDNRVVILRLGTNAVAGDGDYSVTMAMGTTASAEVGLPALTLVESLADYLADAAILDHRGAEMFLGLVESVDLQNGEAAIKLRNGQEMTDTRLGGLGSIAIDARELVWSLARTAGLPDDKVAIHGWTPGPDELFEVVTPLSGLRIDRRFEIADVLVTAEEHIAPSVDDLGPEGIKAAFQQAPCWAVAQVRATTVFDAEVAGTAAVVLAIDWLMARSHYAGAGLPNAEAVNYRRENTLSNIDRGGAVYVRGLATGRRWLRGRSDSVPAHDLAPENVDLVNVPGFFPERLTPQEREAIAAWRRSVEAIDPMARALAISESIEFLCSGLKATGTALFDKTARKGILNYGREKLSTAQQARLEQVVGSLNEPSLSAKLDLWIAREAIALAQSDRDVLDRVRGVRNDFVHGRSRALPSSADLRYASSVVNRMLVQRVHNLSDRGTGPT